MDPNVILDLLYLKLTLEHQHKLKVDQKSFDNTRECLKRLRHPEAPSTVANFVTKLLLKPKTNLDKELARLAIFEPLLFEKREDLFSRFDPKDHLEIKEFINALIPEVKKAKRLTRLRSNLRSKVLFSTKP